jgi:hypothetical protein
LYSPYSIGSLFQDPFAHKASVCELREVDEGRERSERCFGAAGFHAMGECNSPSE